ncbi:hypothetical protein [Sphingopyxis sp. GW247-27LB]|uniref:hypothetical protein n=1 Tax=Sphingopyxis sp. GW247-27LB TaxID=2012632 RepID=UPI000BA72B27|nr:hypothetical protein [Sphingopyxis sp. GW247-27LB]PAL22344.1 hypothetical protein CD928_09545 [Sphingopyxis sp. GW247-27LB]
MQDAGAILDQISGALDAAATFLINNIGDERPLNEIWGWNLPAINRTEFAEIIRSPIQLIQSFDGRNVSDTDFETLSQFPGRISFLQQSVLPNVSGGNAWQVYLTTLSLIDRINGLLEPYVPNENDWEKIEDAKLIPASQLRRLRTLRGTVEKIAGDSEGLAQKISEINEARATAEALPADLQSLAEAREAYAAAMKVIDDNKGAMAGALKAAASDQAAIASMKDQAQQLVASTEAAQAAATTQGLGAAFDQKARALGTSTGILGLVLVGTLATAAVVSALRIRAIHDLIEKPDVSLQLLWVHVMLTAISVAGPVWLAWILTKQIGQRFRLAEDYAFKASVAKAYEGYRREAVRIDPQFEKRLFGSVLDRLDEAPLRHVETENHGSPWAELIVGKITKSREPAPIENSSKLKQTNRPEP